MRSHSPVQGLRKIYDQPSYYIQEGLSLIPYGRLMLENQCMQDYPPMHPYLLKNIIYRLVIFMEDCHKLSQSYQIDANQIYISSWDEIYFNFKCQNANIQPALDLFNCIYQLLLEKRDESEMNFDFLTHTYGKRFAMFYEYLQTENPETISDTAEFIEYINDKTYLPSNKYLNEFYHLEIKYHSGNPQRESDPKYEMMVSHNKFYFPCMSKNKNINYSMSLQNKKTLSYDAAINYDGIHQSFQNMMELCQKSHNPYTLTQISEVENKIISYALPFYFMLSRRYTANMRNNYRASIMEIPNNNNYLKVNNQNNYYLKNKDIDAKGFEQTAIQLKINSLISSPQTQVIKKLVRNSISKIKIGLRPPWGRFRWSEEEEEKYFKSFDKPFEDSSQLNTIEESTSSVYEQTTPTSLMKSFDICSPKIVVERQDPKDRIKELKTRLKDIQFNYLDIRQRSTKSSKSSRSARRT